MAITTNSTSPVPGSSVNVLNNEYERERENQFGLSPDEPTIDLNKTYDEMIGKMGAVATEMLAGEVPKDVQEQVRIMTAENVLAGGQGMGSQAAKFMTARDLGLTSLDIQQRGLAAGQTVAQLTEAKREFNKTYDLNIKQFMQEVRRTDLTATQLMEQSRQFNEELKFRATELAAQTMLNYHQMSMSYSLESDYAQPIQSAAKDVSSIISSLRSRYGG